MLTSPCESDANRIPFHFFCDFALQYVLVLFLELQILLSYIRRQGNIQDKMNQELYHRVV